MVKLLNCRLDEAGEKLRDKRIVFFGQGTWLKSVDYTPLMELKHRFEYVIDNNPRGKVEIGNKSLEVYSPDKLKDETEVVVIFTSPVYMYDMYMQLKDMDLSGNVECYAFPFMQKITNTNSDFSITYKNYDVAKIPKIIHSFWFSGDPKPELYQKCRDSWTKILSEYEIIEWNMNNYDWHKNAFVEKAIECKSWAFASDYARLDVLKSYGGIYLDMDVEVLKPFDDLLSNDAILSYSNNIMVDLAVVGSRKANPIIERMLSLYSDVDIPLEKSGFSKFFQPSFVRATLAESGIRMDGTLQRIDYATVFPHDFFMPLDYVLFDKDYSNHDTYCVHYDNFGWGNGSDKREKKMRDNRLMWSLIDNE